MTSRIACLLMLLGAVLVPAAALAQAPVNSFERLQTVLKPGDRLVVVDSSGAETKGTLRGLSASSLSVQLSDSDAQTFAEGSVATIRRTDSVKNGLLMGLLGGGIVAVTGFASTYQKGTDAVYGWAYIGSWLCPLSGAVIGAVVDSQIGNRPVYVAPPRAGAGRITLSPLVAKRGTGVSLSVRF